MRYLAILAVMVLALVGGGCGSLDKEFVDRMDVPSKVLLPDLRRFYKGEAGPALDPDQVERRIRLLDEWEKTIQEAVKATR